jgi:5-methylcytosine-specific restriction endonuclease McrA
MQDYAKAFYKSQTWQRTRAAYVAYRRGLCEVCLSKGIYKPGVIVHHKQHITPNNINDPTITLSFDNLQLLCRDCHAAAHANRQTRYKFDELGRVICD